MERENKIHKAFYLFCNSDDQKLPTKDLKKVLRHLGHVIDDKSIDQLLHDIDSQSLSYPEFKMIEKKAHNFNTSIDEMREAFKVFDPENTGFIELSELKKILMSSENKQNPNDFNENGNNTENGEDICNQDDFEEILREFGDIADNKINYESFIKLLSVSKDK